MTTFRCDIAKAIVRDVIATWSDWPSELETITGYSLSQYRELLQRLSGGVEFGGEDEFMLRQAALQFIGYPGMLTASVESVLGPNWSEALRGAFLQERER